MKRTCLIFMVLIVLTGCKEKHFFTKSVDINDQWSYDNPAVFNFNIKDNTKYYDMLLDVNHKDSFGYKNIYVKITTTFPDKTSAENIISLNIANSKGAFLGNCSSGTCTETIELQKRFKFKSTGPHKISIHQHSRDSLLKGVKNLTMHLDVLD